MRINQPGSAHYPSWIPQKVLYSQMLIWSVQNDNEQTASRKTRMRVLHRWKTWGKGLKCWPLNWLSLAFKINLRIDIAHARYTNVSAQPKWKTFQQSSSHVRYLPYYLSEKLAYRYIFGPKKIIKYGGILAGFFTQYFLCFVVMLQLGSLKSKNGGLL